MAHYAFQLPNFMKRFGPNPDDLSMDFFASYVSDPINRIQWRLYFKRHAKENSDKEYISVYLKLMKFFDGQCRQVTHRPVVEVTYSIGIRDQEFACVHSKTATHSDWTTDWGWREFLPLDAAREHLLPDGSLFVFCNLDPKQEGRYSIPPSPPSQPSSRCTRFLANSPRTEPTGLGQKLLNDKHHTDVTIVAGEKNPVTFQAHKAVLCIQSSVFAQGFDHKFLPDLPSSHVRVKDFDADTVREMINYVYTGRTDKMTEMAHLLLPAAEKYQLEGLKMEATHELMHNMTTKNVVNTLLLADKHEINELKQRALEFISEHGTDVTECDDWKKLAEKAELMTAVFKATAAKVPANSVNST